MILITTVEITTIQILNGNTTNNTGNIFIAITKQNNKKYNKIDFLFRDIADNVVTLNASSITLTLFIKSFETWDRLSDDCINMNEIDVSKFNITTNISKLDENGCYTKYLDKPFNLKNAKIVNANFLLNGIWMMH